MNFSKILPVLLSTLLIQPKTRPENEPDPGQKTVRVNVPPIADRPAGATAESEAKPPARETEGSPAHTDPPSSPPILLSRNTVYPGARLYVECEAGGKDKKSGGQSGYRLTIDIDTDSLGSLRVCVFVRAEEVAVHFFAGTPSAVTLLKQNVSQLEDSLRELGYSEVHCSCLLHHAAAASPAENSCAPLLDRRV